MRFYIDCGGTSDGAKTANAILEGDDLIGGAVPNQRPSLVTPMCTDARQPTLLAAGADARCHDLFSWS